MCKVKCQRTPPETVCTSNNKYITKQESKEKQHVTTGIRTRTSDVLGQHSTKLPIVLPRRITPGLIFRPDGSVGRVLARNARGPGSNPGGRHMLFFFAFLVGYIFII